MKAYYLTPDGAKIYFENHGDPANPTIFCVPGLFCGSNYWDLQIPALLDAGYHLVTVAPRGHGKSWDQPHNGSLLDQTISDVFGLLDRYYGKEKYIWLGHSLGGAVGLYFAIHYPEIIDKLLLLNTSYVLERNFIYFFIWNIAKFLAVGHDAVPRASKAIFDAASGFMTRYYRMPKDETKVIAEDLHLYSGQTTVFELEELVKYNLKNELHKIKVPTLIIAGNRDWLTPEYRSRIMNSITRN